VLAGSVIHFHRERVVIVSVLCLAIQGLLFGLVAPVLHETFWPVSGAVLVCWAPVVTAAYTPVVNVMHGSWIFTPVEMGAVLCIAALEMIWPIQVLISSTAR